MKTEPDLTVVCSISMHRGKSGRGKLAATPSPAVPIQCAKVPYVARMLALAIKLSDDIDAGRVKDLADIARLNNIARSRVTQIMNLLGTAPDIQEKILFLPPKSEGKSWITERKLRYLARLSWDEQRAVWDRNMKPSFRG